MIGSGLNLAGATAISAFALGVAVMLLGALIAYFTIARTGRLDDDSSGSRSMVAFLMSGAFVTLWGLLYGVVIITAGVVSLIGRNVGFSMAFIGGRIVHIAHPVGDGAARMITVGALFVLIAGGAHLLHERRGRQLAAAEAGANAPAKKIVRSYVATVSFFAVVVAVIDLLVTIYTLLGIIAPGIYQTASRTGSAKGLIYEVVILALAGWSLRSVQSMAPDHLHLFARSGGHHGHDHAHHGALEAEDATVEHAEVD